MDVPPLSVHETGTAGNGAVVAGDVEDQSVQSGVLPGRYSAGQVRVGDRSGVQHSADKLAAYAKEFLAGKLLLVILRGRSAREGLQETQAQEDEKAMRVSRLHIPESIYPIKEGCYEVLRASMTCNPGPVHNERARITESVAMAKPTADTGRNSSLPDRCSRAIHWR